MKTSDAEISKVQKKLSAIPGLVDFYEKRR